MIYSCCASVLLWLGHPRAGGGMLGSHYTLSPYPAPTAWVPAHEQARLCEDGSQSSSSDLSHLHGHGDEAKGGGSETSKVATRP